MNVSRRCNVSQNTPSLLCFGSCPLGRKKKKKCSRAGHRRLTDCEAEALENVERRLLTYELARSSFAFDGGDVTSGGREVRLALGEVTEGSLRGESTSAAMAECLWDWRGGMTPSVMLASRLVSEVSGRGLVMREVEPPWALTCTDGVVRDVRPMSLQWSERLGAREW